MLDDVKDVNERIPRLAISAIHASARGIGPRARNSMTTTATLCGRPEVFEVDLRPSSAASTNPSLSSLTRERFRTFLSEKTYLTASRRTPLEPGPKNAAQLEWEYSETLAFEDKQLKADPRLQPSDIEVTFDHLKECTACAQRKAVRAAMHERWCAGSNCPGSPKAGWQSLVDDHAIYSWRNTFRFVNPPRSQQVAMHPPRNSSAAARFGCPCSVLRDERGEFTMYHTAGSVAGEKHRYKEWPSHYEISSSPDGRGGWRRRDWVRIDGFVRGATGSMTVLRRPRRRGPPSFVAGYEGANSKVCLAHSTDGIWWTTVPTQAPLRSMSERVLEEVNARALERFKIVAKPLHLQKKSHKLDMGKGYLRKLCKPEMRECVRSGRNRAGRLVACMTGKFKNETLSKDCYFNLAKVLGTAGQDCVNRGSSALGRAGDCNIQPLMARGRQLVWYRRDFGTPGGWREIRGVQVVELNASLHSQPVGRWCPPPYCPKKVSLPAPVVQPMARVNSYYLDRLGKLERFRRQIYAVTLTRQSEDLWLGLATVIEWAKDLGEKAESGLPAFARDTTSIYLVASRDGIHLDDDFIYARRPLIPKGKVQGHWRSGFLLAADQIVSDHEQTESRVYFEARKDRHEERFQRPGVIGMAAWRFGTLVGLKAADAAFPAIVTTKGFRVEGERLGVLLNVDTKGGTRCGKDSTLTVEVLSEADEAVLPGASSLPVAGVIDTAMAVRWKVDAGDRNSPQGTSVRIPANSRVRLRFTLTGKARLYAFRVVLREAGAKVEV